MKKIELSTVINAPKEKIWDVLLSDKTYRQWTAAFHPGSYAEGDWSEGSQMLFKGPDGSGMISKVAVHKPFEIISLEHTGVLKNGVEDKDSKEAQEWSGSTETYTLTPADGGLKFNVVQDIGVDYYDEFAAMWHKALQNLKALSEAA